MISLTKHNELKGYKSLDAYPEVAHFVTTRHGGISTGAYGSFNCSPYTNDSCVNVNRNIPAHSLSKHPFLAEVAVSFPMIL